MLTYGCLVQGFRPLPSITAVAPMGWGAAASGATSAPTDSGVPGGSSIPAASDATPSASGASSGAPPASAGAPASGSGMPVPTKSANPNGAVLSHVGKSIFAITLLVMACSTL
ncbi:hypothetical protein K439DRAFT_1621539 [Ramaria rubella]|nr:hypothetical protein K439DRAFT_1621539 [Ramaria rubella]